MAVQDSTATSRSSAVVAHKKELFLMQRRLLQRQTWSSPLCRPSALHCRVRLVFCLEPYQVSGAAYHRKRRGFPVCTATNRRRSAPPRESRFSCLYCNKLVVQSGHKRHLKRKHLYPTIKKPRKEEEPSSTAAPHTKHTSIEPSHRATPMQKLTQGKNSFSGPPWAKRGCFAQPLKVADAHVSVLSLLP